MDRDQPGDAIPTKAELTAQIDRAWQALQATIGAATEDDLTRPGRAAGRPRTTSPTSPPGSARWSPS